MLFDEVLHFFLAPGIHGILKLDVVVCAEVLDELVCTETLMTLFTVHQRIRKTAQMTGCHPGLWIHKDGAVYTYVVGVFHDEFFPPCAFYVVFQLHTQVSIVPGVCQSAVDLGTRINKTSGFCKCHNFVHCFFHVLSVSFIHIKCKPVRLYFLLFLSPTHC